jgi:hypothetical protein
MVCPVCITSALLASGPSIAASIGGVTAMKLAVDRVMSKRDCVKESSTGGVHESLREERDRKLRPVPVRIESQDKWWLPGGAYQRWEEDDN